MIGSLLLFTVASPLGIQNPLILQVFDGTWMVGSRDKKDKEQSTRSIPQQHGGICCDILRISWHWERIEMVLSQARSAIILGHINRISLQDRHAYAYMENLYCISSLSSHLTLRVWPSRAARGWRERAFPWPRRAKLIAVCASCSTAVATYSFVTDKSQYRRPREDAFQYPVPSTEVKPRQIPR